MKEFIDKQPQVYKDAIDTFDHDDYIALLKQHLADKISNEKLSHKDVDDLFFDVTYTDPEVDVHTPQSTFSKNNFGKYIESFSRYIEVLFGTIIYSFEDMKESCYRFLMESNWFKVHYYSSWIVVTYDDSTKDVLLQIGNKFYIRYDHNEIKNCYKRMPDGTVKKIESGYPDIDPTIYAESLVQSLVIEEGLLPYHFDCDMK